MSTTKSGHLYFSLRDGQASVKAVMFRRWASQLAFEPREGMRVVLRCRVSLYEQTGSFQLYAEDIFPEGLGSVQMAFEQLKEKLAGEGLFDEARKKPVPRLPPLHRVGHLQERGRPAGYPERLPAGAGP